MTAQAIKDLEVMLAGLTDEEVHALCLQALRNNRRRRQTIVRREIFGDDLVPLVAAHRGTTYTERELEAAAASFASATQKPWVMPVVEFVWSLVRAGLAIPVLIEPNTYFPNFVLTAAGVRFVETPDVHPLLGGTIKTICDRCVGVDDQVPTLLGDARQCLMHGLLRPAIVLVGIAYEVALEQVAGALDGQRGFCDDPRWKPVQRIAALGAVVKDVFPGRGPSVEEARGAAKAALDFADRLRARRNDAAHTKPTLGFVDHLEVETYFISALRHLPALWAMNAPWPNP